MDLTQTILDYMASVGFPGAIAFALIYYFKQELDNSREERKEERDFQEKERRAERRLQEKKEEELLANNRQLAKMCEKNNDKFLKTLETITIDLKSDLEEVKQGVFNTESKIDELTKIFK